MSWECRHMHNGYCRKRGKDCIPGEPGCVLYGKYEFPFKESGEDKKNKERRTPTNGDSGSDISPEDR